MADDTRPTGQELFEAYSRNNTFEGFRLEMTTRYPNKWPKGDLYIIWMAMDAAWSDGNGDASDGN